MLLRVLLFAAAREQPAPMPSASSCPTGETWPISGGTHPALSLARSALAKSAIAVNQEFAEEEWVLAPSDEVRSFPVTAGKGILAT